MCKGVNCSHFHCWKFLMRWLLLRWRMLTLAQEITIILIVKILVIMLIWWLFFRGHAVEVTPEKVLSAPTLQAKYHEESK